MKTFIIILSVTIALGSWGLIQIIEYSNQLSVLRTRLRDIEISLGKITGALEVITRKPDLEMINETISD